MSVTVCPNGHIHSEHECRLCKPVKKEVCPVCMGTGDDYDYEGGSSMCGACLGTGRVKAALALPSADSSGSDNVPLPSGSGEQPTSVEPREIPAEEKAAIAEFIDNHQHQYNCAICSHRIDLAEERRQAKIAELERLQHTEWVDLAYDIPGYLKDRLTELRGDNNG